MVQISDEELFYFYNNTIDKCGTFLLNETDEIIEYNIYEEFDIGIHSFFHPDNLKRLYNAKLLSYDKLNKSIHLHDMVIELQKKDEWDFEHFRTSKEWRDIMILADKISAMAD